MQLNSRDKGWVSTLIGTAIGAGVLFLPIKASDMGLWALIATAAVILPIVYFAHNNVTNMMYGIKTQGADLTDAYEQYIGKGGALVVSICYVLIYVPVVCIYGVVATNTLIEFLGSQFGITNVSKPFVGFALTALFMLLSIAGERIILKISNILVMVLGLMLVGVTLYLVPHWDFTMVAKDNPFPPFGTLFWSMVAGFGLFVFAFNYAATCTTMGAIYRENYEPQEAYTRTSRVNKLTVAALGILFLTFTFSSMFAFSAQEFAQAKASNVTIFTSIANKFDNPFISIIAPVLALLAITTSFVGIYLGAQEASIGLMARAMGKEPSVENKKVVQKIVIVMIAVLVYSSIIFNPSVLDIMGNIIGPLVIFVTYFTPIWAYYKAPALARFRNKTNDSILVVFSLSVLIYVLSGMI